MFLASSAAAAAPRFTPAFWNIADQPTVKRPAISQPYALLLSSRYLWKSFPFDVFIFPPHLSFTKSYLSLSHLPVDDDDNSDVTFMSSHHLLLAADTGEN